MAKRGRAGTGTDEEMDEVIGNGTPQSSMADQQGPGGDVGRDTRREDVAVQLSELAQDLQSERSTQEVLAEIVAAAVANVPGAGQAGISQVQGRRRISTAAATADLVRHVDQAQYDTGKGPCLSTIYEQITALVPDTSTSTEDRWPRFAARANALGIKSLLSIRLYVRGEDLGALNLYSDEPGSFGEESVHIGRLLASHASVALADAQRHERLLAAVDTRDLIGQAKGILMERHRISADQAFALLVQVSQSAHQKLREVAEQLAASGEIPRVPDR